MGRAEVSAFTGTWKVIQVNNPPEALCVWTKLSRGEMRHWHVQSEPAQPAERAPWLKLWRENACSTSHKAWWSVFFFFCVWKQQASESQHILPPPAERGLWIEWKIIFTHFVLFWPKPFLQQQLFSYRSICTVTSGTIALSTYRVYDILRNLHHLGLLKL